MASYLDISRALPAELSEKAPQLSDLDLDSRNPVVETSELAYKVILTLFVKHGYCSNHLQTTGLVQINDEGVKRAAKHVSTQDLSVKCALDLLVTHR